eukprot:Protomagalhaensia_sp_Gyna_25__2994@NODE_2767_length_898_cov_1_797439_g2309_i0_p1_GENE_NODE_2767_length_898_cov_1_797439_g2309_i0NODE_2767_length_898_cov_1_797439_g2309_i0_p1_ORF_typecomplete_len223_score24_43_NODE_2767_length_898_cov_1_797439_g2309_i0176844
MECQAESSTHPSLSVVEDVSSIGDLTVYDLSSPDSGSHPLSTLRSGLRSFVAQDAIWLALEDPKTYRALIDQRLTVTGPPKERRPSEPHTPAGVVRSFSSDDESDSAGSTRTFNDLGKPPLEASMTSWVHAIVPFCCLVHSFRDFCNAHHSALLWGGPVVIVPYLVLAVFFTFPMMVLEMSISNVVRGSIAKGVQAASPVFQGMAACAWVTGAWRLVQELGE